MCLSEISLSSKVMLMFQFVIERVCGDKVTIGINKYKKWEHL